MFYFSNSCSSLKKQLIVARDTRRVDILCYRLSLSQKISVGAGNCPKLYEVLDEAVKKLEADVGPLTGLPVKMARGIVNRLSFGPAVQQLCGLAVEHIDALLSERVSEMPSNAKVKGNTHSNLWFVCAVQRYCPCLFIDSVDSPISSCVAVRPLLFSV